MSISKPSPETKFPIIQPDGNIWPYTVYLKNFITQENFQVGDWTYYNDERVPIESYARRLAPYLFPQSPEKIVLGKFVQIAQGTQFITSSANHQMSGFSTYPFFVFGPPWNNIYQPDLPKAKDTIVGHDVWFGHESTIMPGVKIGSGAIIGTRAVVTKDVPAYAIVAGNPGRVVKYRFPETIIDKLLSIAWWDWPIDLIEQNLPVITGADIDALQAISTRVK
ncbi:MAG: acetyltransferase [Rickettsiales bacterium]|nr:acetyltransferase [Rickettsiales bacterium]|tara:strand:- start:10014 stop:10679 length:666 start_codon:yes stop_codon:yes gene_type:complete